MVHDLKPYPAMKDSGVPWLGEVPDHWDVLALGGRLVERKEKNDPIKTTNILSLSLKTGVVPYAEKGAGGNKAKEDLSAYILAYPGDIVVNSMNVVVGSVGLSKYFGAVSPVYFVLHPRFDVDLVKYYDAVFHDVTFQRSLFGLGNGIMYIESRSSGKLNTIRLRIPFSRLKRVLIPCPGTDEQVAIVRFLDHAERRIRRYIRVKQKLIKLLEEQKQAIIHRAVTRGLDTNVRLKPSGVEWLGEIPEHWEVKRVKRVAQILRGKFTHRPRNDPSLYDGPYPFIQTGEVARAGKSIISYRQTLNERGLAVSKLFPAGTLVMTIAANIGDVAVLDFEACFPDSVVGFVTRDGVERDFLYYVFHAMQPELLREAPVNTQGNLNVDRIGSRGVPLPPAAEQREIVLGIESDTIAINDAITKAYREISLLREYRVRLIADVVTGKLDVREVAANLPEEAEEPELIEDVMEEEILGESGEELKTVGDLED